MSLTIGEGSHTPANAMSFSEETTMLCNRVKEQDKEIRHLRAENEFLEEASAFSSASRRKSARTREWFFWLWKQRTAWSPQKSHFISECLVSADKASINTSLTKPVPGSIRIWHRPWKNPQWPWNTIYQRDLPSDHPGKPHSSKHEQCRWTLPW